MNSIRTACTLHMQAIAGYSIESERFWIKGMVGCVSGGYLLSQPTQEAAEV